MVKMYKMNRAGNADGAVYGFAVQNRDDGKWYASGYTNSATTVNMDAKFEYQYTYGVLAAGSMAEANQAAGKFLRYYWGQFVKSDAGETPEGSHAFFSWANNLTNSGKAIDGKWHVDGADLPRDKSLADLTWAYPGQTNNVNHTIVDVPAVNFIGDNLPININGNVESTPYIEPVGKKIAVVLFGVKPLAKVRENVVNAIKKEQAKIKVPVGFDSIVKLVSFESYIIDNTKNDPAQIKGMGYYSWQYSLKIVSKGDEFVLGITEPTWTEGMSAVWQAEWGKLKK
jgi:hypothetical protein